MGKCWCLLQNKTEATPGLEDSLLFQEYLRKPNRFSLVCFQFCFVLENGVMPFLHPPAEPRASPALRTPFHVLTSYVPTVGDYRRFTRTIIQNKTKPSGLAEKKKKKTIHFYLCVILTIYSTPHYSPDLLPDRHLC